MTIAHRYLYLKKERCVMAKTIYITISTFASVRPYGGVRYPGVPILSFQFLQVYEKVSLIKVAWYVFRVKNIHSWSPPDPMGP